MDDVIYGVILSANTDNLEKEPPVNVSTKPNAPPVCCANHCAKNSLFTPGAGIRNG